MGTARLAIVIPVWNLPDDLANLLRQISAMQIFSQVVVVDDGSSLDCNPNRLDVAPVLASVELTYIKSPVRKSAGHARNLGLRAVTAENVMFFDADDQLCDAFPEIWQQHLQAKMPDFTIFRHSDNRVEDSEGRQGTFLHEEAMWKTALHAKARRLLTPQERADLVMISAFPWNKIYRTAFLRDNSINCSETPVHNDIRLHWLSFLKAETIQATSLIGARHVIGDREHHLTKLSGRERLCLGEILADVTYQIRQEPGQHLLMQRFIHFVDNTCRWNLDQIDQGLIPAFQVLARQSYLRFTPEEFRLFSIEQPTRAAQVVQFLMREVA